MLSKLTKTLFTYIVFDNQTKINSQLGAWHSSVGLCLNKRRASRPIFKPKIKSKQTPSRIMCADRGISADSQRNQNQ